MGTHERWPQPEDYEELQEYCSYRDQGCLTRLQLQIVATKIGTHCMNIELCREYNVSGNKALIHCFLRTIQGRYWAPGMKTGTLPYLSECDSHLFLENSRLACNGLNCLLTFQAVSLAQQLKKRRRKIAEKLLHLMEALEYLKFLESTEEPSRSWLKDYANAHGLVVCSTQQLELARRLYCDKGAINTFFDATEDILRCDRRLIFNMDETSVSAAKRFRVLRNEGKLPIVVGDGKLPHLTAVLTISASGKLMKTMVILPKLKSLKSLVQFVPQVSFCSSVTGWMNSELFLLWVIDFCHQISWYRTYELPAELRHETIRLVMDGHPSRINFRAWCLLRANGICLILLPGHTTHVLQPIDLAVTAPLKTRFKRNILEQTNGGLEIDITGTLTEKEIKQRTADQIRCILVRALVNALPGACSLTNIESGFAASGLCPVERNIPLRTEFAVDPQQVARIYGSIRHQQPVTYSASFEENIEALGRHTLGHNPTPEDIQIDEADCLSMFQNGRGKTNVLVSAIASKLTEIDDGLFRIEYDQ